MEGAVAIAACGKSLVQPFGLENSAGEFEGAGEAPVAAWAHALLPPGQVQ